MKIRKLLLTLGCFACFASCERVLMSGEGEATATAVFDYLWQQTDRQYSMFDVKGVDWQAVYDTLRPKVWDGMDEKSLFAVCAEMLSTLEDGHVNLYSRYDVSHSDSIYYRFYRESQIDINAVVLNYLGAGYHTTGGFAHQGLEGGKVAYLRYGSFSNGISEEDLKYIVGEYQDAEGMILDIRGNGGGSISNINKILRMFPSRGQHLYSSQIKSGPGHDDFTTLKETYAPEDYGEDWVWRKPVYVLTDRGSYSASSMFAVCCKAYDNVVLVGDTTGGGLGLPTMGYLPNGWRYRMPVTRLLTPDGKNYENGVPPDSVVCLDRELAMREGKDNIIEEVCGMILKKQWVR